MSACGAALFDAGDRTGMHQFDENHLAVA